MKASKSLGEDIHKRADAIADQISEDMKEQFKEDSKEKDGGLREAGDAVAPNVVGELLIAALQGIASSL